MKCERQLFTALAPMLAAHTPKLFDEKFAISVKSFAFGVYIVGGSRKNPAKKMAPAYCMLIYGLASACVCVCVGEEKSFPYFFLPVVLFCWLCWEN